MGKPIKIAHLEEQRPNYKLSNFQERDSNMGNQ